MNKNSFSYKQGFRKGIEIYNNNSNKGYYSDQDNEKTITFNGKSKLIERKPIVSNPLHSYFQ